MSYSFTEANQTIQQNCNSDLANKIIVNLTESARDEVSYCEIFADKEAQMPNMVMEFTSSVEDRVNVQLLLEELHQKVLESGVFEADAVKSRAIRCHHWLIGEHGDSEDFIHITFELLSGRSEEQKRELSRQLMTVTQQHASNTKSITVNIRDMDKSCFQKTIN